jgi:hypothetical protein
MSSAGYRPTGCHAASGALIFYGLSGANRRFQFEKRFISLRNETLSIGTMSVCNLASGRDGVTTPGKLA